MRLATILRPLPAGCLLVFVAFSLALPSLPARGQSGTSAPDTTKMSPLELMAYRAQRQNGAKAGDEAGSKPELPELPAEITRVSDTPGNEASPCWSPDGKTLYFTYSTKSLSRLFKLDLASGERAAVTDSVYSALEPDLSPDGKYIAYAERQPGLGKQVWIRRLSDNATAKLTQNPGPDSEEFPRWVNSGMSLLYSHNVSRSPDSRAMSVERDGENSQVLMDDNAMLLQPAMSFSGQKVAWVRRQGSSATLRIQDMRLKMVVDDYELPGRYIADAEWLPGDVRMLVVSLERSKPRGGFDIGIFDLASNELEPLINIGHNDLDPRLSPDGKRIAFISNRHGQSDLYIFELP